MNLTRRSLFGLTASMAVASQLKPEWMPPSAPYPGGGVSGLNVGPSREAADAARARFEELMPEVHRWHRQITSWHFPPPDSFHLCWPL